MESLWSDLLLATQLFKTMSIGSSRKRYMDYTNTTHQWYNTIKRVLLNMGLNSSPHDPWLLSDVFTNPSSTYCTSDLQYQIHVGLYVDEFVFYLSEPTHEELLKNLLQEKIQVDFMRNVDYWLGTAFNWLQHTSGNISVHLCQFTFTELTTHHFSVHTPNKVPNMTPYCSSLPIHSIPPIDNLYPDLPRRRQVYQIIFGCINWLATCTRPGIATALIFIALYRNAPHPQHYKATVHALKYLTRTNEYGISFH